MVSPPFTVEEFIDVFRTYNTAVWPIQIVAYALAGTAILLAVKRTAFSSRLIGAILAFFWLWTGAVYHMVFFTPINGAAFGFGAAFIAQGLLFLGACVWKDRIAYRYAPGLYSLVGGVFVIYAMILYPILGAASGHMYPACPTFGVTPCPMTIFTFGILLFASSKVPWYLLVIPLVWSVIGVQAAVSFGMGADFALPAAGILGTVLVVLKNRMMVRGSAL
jgi:hypothetical protein